MPEPAAVPNINPLDFIKYIKYAPLVVQIVGAVQAIFGPGDGAAKKVAAVKALAGAVAVTEGVSEKDLVNDAAFLALADELIELGVTLMKLQPRFESIAAQIRALKPKTA
jgi:hypothetical protein